MTMTMRNQLIAVRSQTGSRLWRMASTLQFGARCSHSKMISASARSNTDLIGKLPS